MVVFEAIDQSLKVDLVDMVLVFRKLANSVKLARFTEIFETFHAFEFFMQIERLACGWNYIAGYMVWRLKENKSTDTGKIVLEKNCSGLQEYSF